LQNLLETLRACAQFLKNAGLTPVFPAKPEVLQLAPWITVLKAIGLIVIIPLIILVAFGGKGTGFGGSSAGRKRRRNRNGGGFF